jgi:hypothetical protein
MRGIRASRKRAPGPRRRGAAQLGVTRHHPALGRHRENRPRGRRRSPAVDRISGRALTQTTAPLLWLGAADRRSPRFTSHSRERLLCSSATCGAVGAAQRHTVPPTFTQMREAAGERFRESAFRLAHDNKGVGTLTSRGWDDPVFRFSKAEQIVSAVASRVPVDVGRGAPLRRGARWRTPEPASSS